MISVSVDSMKFPFSSSKKNQAYLEWIFPSMYKYSEALSNSGFVIGKHSSVVCPVIIPVTLGPLIVANPSTALPKFISSPVKV